MLKTRKFHWKIFNIISLDEYVRISELRRKFTHTTQEELSLVSILQKFSQENI